MAPPFLHAVRPVSASSIVLGEIKPLSYGGRIIDCDHTPHIPRFNASACVGKSPQWIRENFPRYQSRCTVCSQEITLYANLEHMQAGGWHLPHQG